MSQENFQKALGKLVTDEAFRATIQANPNSLTDAFQLDENELRALIGVGQAASGIVAPEDTYCCCCCCP